jgi:hypothetical protein
VDGTEDRSGRSGTRRALPAALPSRQLLLKETMSRASRCKSDEGGAERSTMWSSETVAESSMVGSTWLGAASENTAAGNMVAGRLMASGLAIIASFGAEVKCEALS